MIDLTREGNVFVLTMNDGENRWNTSFVREFARALDEVEASEGPAALVTTSATEKFFSNGLDLEWRASDDANHRGGDRDAFGVEFMFLMGRIITLPRLYVRQRSRYWHGNTQPRACPVSAQDAVACLFRDRYASQTMGWTSIPCRRFCATNRTH